MPRPTLPQGIEDQLLRVGGLNRHGEPRFRFVWGMSEEVFMQPDAGDNFEPGWYLKYELCHTKKLLGYFWKDGNRERWASRLEDIPKDVLTALPKFKTEQIGRPHWILEEWHDEGDCMGAYDHPGYYWCRWIERDDLPENEETFLRPYREPNQSDIDFVARYVYETAQLTDNLIKQGVKDQKEQEAQAAQQARDEMREELIEELIATARDAKHIDIARPTKKQIETAWQRLQRQSASRKDH